MHSDHSTCITREAQTSDIPELVSLLKILFSIEKDFSFDETKQSKGLHLMIDNKNGCILVAENSGTIIGMCSGQITVSTAEGGPSLLVEDVVVKDDRRSQGVGKLLMNEMSKWAELMGASRLQLLAETTNSGALGFYKKLGWTSTQLICLRKYIH